MESKTAIDVESGTRNSTVRVFAESACLSGEAGLPPSGEIQQRRLQRVTAHRPPALKLPADSRDAAAQALAFIRGEDSYVRAQAIEALTARVTVLRDGDSDGALDELAAHVPILEALWLKFAVEATMATKPEHKATLLRMALSAQTSYTRTLIALAGLRSQRAGRGRISVADAVEGDS